MKILVPIKRVPDYAVKVKIKGDNSGIETDGIKWILNPFDEIAIEEALRIKESGKATEVVVVGIGPSDVQQNIRTAMAMGADRGILVVYDGYVDSDLASRILKEIYSKESPGLVIMGKQAIDSDANQTGQLLATRLNLPQGCFASKVVIEDGYCLVTREVDGGLETLKLSTPAVITTDLRLNEPRYASLPNIMKAKKKPLEELPISSLSVDAAVKVVVKKFYAPEPRKGGRKVSSVQELVKALREEAKVI